MKLKRVYAEIAKSEPQEDGTLKVYGYASSGSVDSDGEVITAEAMKAALPDYMKFGAVREMHQPIAAGTAIEAEVQEDGRTYFAAHVVDPVAIKKVQTKTYKGFSIGGKVMHRDENDDTKITALKLIEVSLVDRPANPDAVFTMYKADIEKGDTENDTAEADVQHASVERLADMLNKGEITAQEAVSLIEGEIARKAAPAVEKKKTVPSEVKKGMSGLCQFASLLQSASWLTQDTAAEAEWEADNSAVPAMLRDWITQGVMIFNSMSVEETAELIASIQPVKQLSDNPEATKAAGANDVAKVGARFSKTTKAALAAIHKACADACEHLGKLGYEEAEEEDDEDAGGDSSKASKPDVTKTDGAGDLLKAELVKATNLIGTLTKRVEQLEAQPAAAKGVLKVVSKGDDVQDPASNPSIEPVRKSDGTIDEAATLTKSVHASGGRLIFPM